MASVEWSEIMAKDPEANLSIERVAYTSYRALGRDLARVDALGSRMKGTIWENTDKREEALQALRECRSHLREAEKHAEVAYRITYQQRAKQRKDKK